MMAVETLSPKGCEQFFGKPEKRNASGVISPLRGIASLDFFRGLRPWLTSRVGVAIATSLGITTGVVALESVMSSHQPTAQIERSLEPANNHLNQPDWTQEFGDWFGELSPREKMGLLIVGVLSIMPAVAAARGVGTFVKTRGNVSERANAVTAEYIDDPRAKLISASAMAGLTALSAMCFGPGRVDIAMTFTSGSILATLLPAWWALDKNKESVSAFVLQQLAPAALAAFVGLAVAENFVLVAREGKPFLYPADWSPHVIAVAGIGFLALKKYADLGNVSRAHLRDVANLLLDMPPSLREALGVLETDRLPIDARDLLIAVGQKQIRALVLSKNGLLEKVFETLKIELAKKNRQAVIAENKKRAKEGLLPMLPEGTELIKLDISLEDQELLVRRDLLHRVKEQEREAAELKAAAVAETKTNQSAIGSIPKKKRNRPKHSLEA